MPSLPEICPSKIDLVSAVEVANGSHAAGQTEFAHLLQADVARRLRDLDGPAIVTPPSLRLAGVRAGCGAVLLLATAVGAVPLLGPAVDAGRLAFFPGTIQVDVLPGNVRIPIGAPIRLKSVVRGRRGPLSGITPGPTITAGTD